MSICSKFSFICICPSSNWLYLCARFVYALALLPINLTCSQLADVTAPTMLLDETAGQGSQLATSVVSLNLPATHSLHSSPGARNVHDTPTDRLSLLPHPDPAVHSPKDVQDSSVASAPVQCTSYVFPLVASSVSPELTALELTRV
jgi:hypothetical protein